MIIAGGKCGRLLSLGLLLLVAINEVSLSNGQQGMSVQSSVPNKQCSC